MVVDAHTHMPEELAERPALFAEILCRHGIGHAIVSGSDVLRKRGPAGAHNDRLAAFCSGGQGMFTALGTVYLCEGRDAVAEARRCFTRLGMHGLKLHPWLQGESLAMPVMDDLARVAGDAGVPILFHDGTPAYSLPSQVGQLAMRFSGTTFVLGHAGILHYWEEALAVGRECPNVHLLLCGPHPWAMQRICDELGADRIMWGTDFGFGMNEGLITYRLGLAGLLRVERDEADRIMGGNARRVFHIGGEQ